MYSFFKKVKNKPEEIIKEASLESERNHDEESESDA